MQDAAICEKISAVFASVYSKIEEQIDENADENSNEQDDFDTRFEAFLKEINSQMERNSAKTNSIVQENEENICDEME